MERTEEVVSDKRGEEGSKLGLEGDERRTEKEDMEVLSEEDSFDVCMREPLTMVTVPRAPKTGAVGVSVVARMGEGGGLGCGEKDVDSSLDAGVPVIPKTGGKKWKWMARGEKDRLGDKGEVMGFRGGSVGEGSSGGCPKRRAVLLRDEADAVDEGVGGERKSKVAKTVVSGGSDQSTAEAAAAQPRRSS